MQTIETGKLIEVPPEVARCPYCKERLCCQPTAWDEEDDGSWSATESGLECWGEPDIDSDEWEEWNAEHSVMPYVHWLPVDLRVLEWLKANYRFAHYTVDL